MTATIGGKRTNRVRVRRWRRRPEGEPRRDEPKRYRADRTVRDVVQACLSLPRELVQRIDQEATRLRQSRSHYVRRAVMRLLEGE